MKLGANLLFLGAAIAAPEIVAPLVVGAAIGYSVADAFGAFDDFYNQFSNEPRLNVFTP